MAYYGAPPPAYGAPPPYGAPGPYGAPVYGAPPPAAHGYPPPQHPGHGYGQPMGKGGGGKNDNGKTPCGRFKLCTSYTNTGHCTRERCGFAHYNQHLNRVENEADCEAGLAEWRKNNPGKGGGAAAPATTTATAPRPQAQANNNNNGMIVVCAKGLDEKPEEKKVEESLDQKAASRLFDHRLLGANGVQIRGVVPRRAVTRLLEDANKDIHYGVGTVPSLPDQESCL